MELLKCLDFAFSDPTRTSQLKEVEFRKNCECVIDNDGDLNKTREDIKRILN